MPRLIARKTLQELQALPNSQVGHFEDLKINTGTHKVWLSRMTVADGAKYDNGVTVERFKAGEWKIVDMYQARDESATLHLLEITIRPNPVNAVPSLFLLHELGAIVDAFNGVEPSNLLEDEK